MPVVIFLFFLPLIAAAVIFGFGAFVGYVVIPVLKFGLGVAAVGGAGYGLYLLYDKDRKSAAQRKARHEDHAETIRLYRLAARKYPTTEQFLEVLTEHLTEELRRANLTPSREVLAQMMLAASEMYDADIPDQPPVMPSGPLETEEDEFMLQEDLRPAAEYAENFDAQLIGQAIVSCFMVFARALPPVREQQFRAPADQFMPVAQVVTDLTMPFYADELKSRDLLQSVRSQYHRGAVYAMMQQIKRPKEGELVWPRQYKGADVPGVYLPPNLAALFKVAVPFGLSDETRFMHHHVLGDTGTGKTTFLSHLIRYDLDKVARGECSVVIIDSTRRMVRSLAKSKWFAPGGPLHGRLILVGPEDPIALNLFADKSNIDASVDIISYAIAGNLQGGEDSIFQAGAARYITRAIIEHGGNILDFDKILQPKGHFDYQDAIARCPQNVRDYFTRTFSGLRDQSRQSLLEKIAFVREKTVLERMFTAPDCRLDLFDKLQEGGNVVLVDADKEDLTSEGSSLLGRFFIAMLNRVVQLRAPFDEFSLKPIWVYLDEAQNYIKSDSRFAEMLTDARQRRIGLTVAHHDWTQILSPDVKLGLQGAAIHTNTISRGMAAVSFRKGPSYEIPYIDFQFRDLPPMSPGDWARVRADNQAKYGAVVPKVPDIRIDQDATTQF